MKTILSVLAVVGLASAASATVSITPLSTFGNNGWRAPRVIQSGDVGGAQTVGANPTFYGYLGDGLLGSSAGLERSMAFNPATGDLILLSRSGLGGGVRIIDGQTARDKGNVNENLASGSSTFSGGSIFTRNTVAVDGAGAIYIANLTTPSATSTFKVYRWSSQTSSVDAAPLVNVTSATVTAARVGDSVAVIGSGANARLAYGYNAGTNNGFILVDGSTGAVTNVNPLSGGGTTSEFRLGLTFAGDANNLWGRSAGQLIRRASDTGSGFSSLGTTSLGVTDNFATTQFSYATVGGIPYLAAVDTATSLLKIYMVADPANPVFITSATNTSGSLVGNANATGAVQWGAIDDVAQTATIYTLVSNQGLQAFQVQLPAPSAAALLGLGGLIAARRRRA
jgi:hypothetical protein